MTGIEQFLTAWDRSAFHAVNHGWKTPFLDTVMPHVSDLGLGHVQVLGVLAAAILLALLAREIHRPGDLWRALVARRRWIVPVLVAFALSGICANIVKRSVVRDRPVYFYRLEHNAGRELDREVETIPGRRPVERHGFLSGHTATTTAIIMTLTLLYWRMPRARWWLVGGWLLAALISVSRIYIADHWPLDVVCGAFLGIASGFAAIRICRGWIGLPAAAPANATVTECAEEIRHAGRIAHES